MGTSTEQVESFLRAVGRKHPVLILPHVNPDPDSLASALGLQAILAHHGVESVIGALGIIGRAENRAMVRVLDIDLVRQKNLDFKQFPKVVLLDSQPGRKNVGLPPRRVPAAVIDHHPNWGTCDRVPYCDIREGYGATSTMVAEYLQTAGIEIDARLATALLYGIASETQDLGRDAYKPDHEAHMVLYPLADKQKLSRIRVPTLTKTYFRALHGAMESAGIYDDVLVSAVKKLHYPDLVAELADYFLRIDGVKWAWVIGAYEGEYYLSCRTQDRTQNAAVVMAKVLRKIGQGGGHESIAGGKATPAENPDVDLPAEIEKRILRLLGKKVSDRAPLIVEDAPKPAPKSDKSDKDKADA